MKNRIHAPRSMNALASAALAASTCLGFALALASGCANDTNVDGKSGETHFLCSTDTDCTRHFGNHEYYCGPKKYCESKTDGGTSQGDGGQTGTGGSANGGNGAGGKVGTAGTSSGSDFASCKTPPNSTCSKADTCAALGCPSLEYDENGCQRQECEKDDDCAADERCALNNCESPSACMIENGTCVCSGPDICGQRARCNPTTTTGPRGDWVSLDMAVVQSPCVGPTFDRCTKTWHVTPDGHLTFTDGSQGADGGTPVDTTLDTAQMYEVAGAVRGSDLRLAMLNGLPCASNQALDVSLKFSLGLSTRTMTSGEVGGCIGGDSVYALLYNILSQAGGAPGRPPGGTGSTVGPQPQAAATFSAQPAPGKTCTHTSGQLSFPSKYLASVISELSCDANLGCHPDDYVVVNGDTGSTVSCSVVPSGNDYNVQLALLVDGSATNIPSGQLNVTGTVSKTGGIVSVQESNSVAGGGGSQQDCTLTIAPPMGAVEPGKLWASFECNAFRDQTDIGETGCQLRGQFLFENCQH